MTIISQCRKRLAFFAAAMAALLLATSPAVFANDHFRISTLSTKPELVSGGDVLVRIDVPRKVSLQSVRVELNEKDITSVFHADTVKRTLTGLVSGLKLGRNELEATTNRQGHDGAERLVVVNHPISGPIFSGPHQTPFICETEVFGLGAALDEDCSAPTKIEYLYFSTANTFRTFDPSAPRPGDSREPPLRMATPLTSSFAQRPARSTAPSTRLRFSTSRAPRFPTPGPKHPAGTVGLSTHLVVACGRAITRAAGSRAAPAGCLVPALWRPTSAESAGFLEKATPWRRLLSTSTTSAATT